MISNGWGEKTRPTCKPNILHHGQLHTQDTTINVIDYKSNGFILQFSMLKWHIKKIRAHISAFQSSIHVSLHVDDVVGTYSDHVTP